GKLDRVFYPVRNMVNSWQQRGGRRRRRAATRARCVLAVTDEDRRMAERLGASRVEFLLDTGTTLRPGRQPKRRDSSRPLQLVWSGLNIGRKVLPILLHALARLDDDIAVQAVILGDGALHRSWKALAGQLGVGRHVQWM